MNAPGADLDVEHQRAGALGDLLAHDRATRSAGSPRRCRSRRAARRASCRPAPARRRPRRSTAPTSSSWRIISSLDSDARQPGIDSSLSRVPPVWPSPRPGQLGHGDPAGRHQRRERQRDLVAHPAGRVLVGGRPRQRRRSPSARRDAIIAVGPAGDLAAVHPVEQDRHRQRRHLLVGDLAPGVGVDDPVDLAVARARARRAWRRSPRRRRACSSATLSVAGLLLHPDTGTDGSRAARTCPGARGSPASRRPGNRSNSAVSDSASSIRASGAPRQKCTPTPKARCGLGSRSTSNASGVGEDRRVAVGRAEQRGDLLAGLDDDVRRPRPARSRCARTAAAPSRSAASPRPGRAPRRPPAAAARASSSATSPLPKTLTDASWPALSSSTTAATTSSSVSPSVARTQVGDQVVAGSARRSATSSRTRPANSLAARDRRVDDLAATAPARTSARSPATSARSDGRVDDGHPEQLGDDQHRQRLGVLPDDVEAAPGRPRRAARRPARAPAAAAARRGRG